MKHHHPASPKRLTRPTTGQWRWVLLAFLAGLSTFALVLYTGFSLPRKYIVRFHAEHMRPPSLGASRPMKPARPTYRREYLPAQALPRNMVAVVAAQHVREAPLLWDYELSLEYTFLAFERVYSVVRSAKTHWDFIESYPFVLPPVYCCGSGARGGGSGNASSGYGYGEDEEGGAWESQGLQDMVAALEASGGLQDPSDIVFKLSGGYQIPRGDFLEEVLANPNFDVWGRFTGGEADTFLPFMWAMRWGHFREYYGQSVAGRGEFVEGGGEGGMPGTTRKASRHLLEYIQRNSLAVYNASYLHVVGRVGENEFVYF